MNETKMIKDDIYIPFAPDAGFITALLTVGDGGGGDG